MCLLLESILPSWIASGEWVALARLPFLPISRIFLQGPEVRGVTKYFLLTTHFSAGCMRFVVLLSALMRSAKSSPNSKAEPAGTLFANFCVESWKWSFMLSLLQKINSAYEQIIYLELLALLICIVIFCKIMSWPFKWELSIFLPFQISSLRVGTKILSQFPGTGYYDSLFLNLFPERFCCQRFFTIIARCGY